MLVTVSASRVHADDDGSSAEVSAQTDEARRLFRQGVDAASDGAWATAAGHFEASLSLEARVATAFNLVVARERLGEWVAAARAADLFFSLADESRHAEQWAQARAVQQDAAARVARARVEVSPAPATVRVDGEADSVPSGVDLWLSPGDHEFVVHADGFAERRFSWHLTAGVLASREVTLEPLVPEDERPAASGRSSHSATEHAASRAGGEPQVPLQPQVPQADSTRRVLAYVSGTGALVAVGAGLGLYLGAVGQADALEGQDPYDAGFLSRAQHYRNLRNWSVGASGLGAALLGLAGLAYADTTDVTWDYYLAAGGGAFALSGAYLMAQTPERIGNTSVTRPTRYLGADLLAIGVPLLLTPLYRLVWPSARKPVSAAKLSFSADSFSVSYGGRF